MFLTKLESLIQTQTLFDPGEKLLVGVSGGCDSIALLEALFELSPKYGWRIFVVHVNHHLRGDASDGDARYVSEFCQQRQISYQIKDVDVRAKKETAGGNKQAIARELRYQAFRKAAEEWNIKKIVLAHHADDQVETILMRIIRGTGPSGIAGMHAKREWGNLQIVRPLLGIYRKELENYLSEKQIVPREDASNQSTDYTRNRLRLELIPNLLSYNPQAKQAILQLGSLIKEEEKVWENWTIEGVNACSQKISEEEYQIDLPAFLSYPVALQRRMVKLILSCLTDENLPYYSIEQVLQLGVHQSPSVWIFLPGGIKGVRSYEILRLTKDYINQGEDEWYYPLPIPSTTYLPYGVIEATLSTTPTHLSFRESHHKAVFDADELELQQLAVRNRRAGDYIHPYGFKGRKRVKALLMEHKIPQAERGKVPMVVSSQEIIWIPGIRRSSIAPVTSKTTHYLTLHWMMEQNS
ncbi:tRNA lysidine(34) synthetase TilS [Shimazuella sp. AN120528]|uniref:tRNA lysidine(34) synthetase TilS n=1 Tax=Shimazuella soli TaxID=1892854 RepID=UPI001F0DFA07|nr:tRNA lysidine(34) synthetase TilS [Shimazuella soli]MCH5585872.1 tRNA lysidine(34) synthetase TilS [Shimazuella soli]